MIGKLLRASWRVISMLTLISSTSGCMCMGAGEVMDRLSKSHESHQSMCGGGMMKHDTTKKPASTQPGNADPTGAQSSRSAHGPHGHSAD